MKSLRYALWMLPACLLAVALIALPARAAEEGEKKGEHTELGKHMEVLDKAIKGLKKSLKDPAKNEDSLKLVVQAEEAALASKQLPPAMVAKAPAADQPKLLLGYRKAMASVVADLCKMEQQILDGKNEDAVETLKSLKDMESDGHEKYNP